VDGGRFLEWWDGPWRGVLGEALALDGGSGGVRSRRAVVGGVECTGGVGEYFCCNWSNVDSVCGLYVFCRGYTCVGVLWWE